MAAVIAAFIFALALLGPAQAAGAQQPDSCLDCHAAMTEQIVMDWEASVHKKVDIGCASCHGGDPADSSMDSMSPDKGFVGKPERKDVPQFCARCHADPVKMRAYNIPTDQFAKYSESVHGLRLAREGDPNVATCVSCHGTDGAHKIISPKDPASPVYRENIPKTCSKCHSDPKLMGGYGIPTNQLELYAGSVHGKELLLRNNKSVPSCADCHGTHGASPPGVKEVAEVCGSCHTQTKQYFNEGPHGSRMETAAIMKCVSCHGNHDVSRPRDEMMLGSGQGSCTSCHGTGSAQFDLAQGIYGAIKAVEETRDEADKLLDEAHAKHMDVTEAAAKLPDVQTGLILARSVQHSLSLDKVKEKTDEALSVATEIKKAAEKALENARTRKNILAMTTTVVLLMAIVIYLRSRLGEPKPERRRA